MNDLQLLRICFVIAFLGLGALFFLSRTVEGEIITISGITEEKVGQKVAVQGVVHDIRQIKSMTLFSLEEDAEDADANILIVSFSEIEVNENEFVKVIGTVKEYKGEVEVVADRIERDE